MAQRRARTVPVARHTWHAGRVGANVISESDLELLRSWAQKHSPEHLKHELRIDLEIKPRQITVVDSRPLWRGTQGEWISVPVARMTYSTAGLWTLYWPDRNSRFHRYGDLAPTPYLSEVLDEIDDDPTAIFWG